MKKLKKPVVTELDFDLLGKVCKQLAHPRKLAAIQYIHSAKFATASVIQRKCCIKQPSVSRYLKTLTAVGLLTREKVGASVIYHINTVVWNQVSILVGKISA